MHVPPSSGHPGEPEAFTSPIGQPEVLAGPTGGHRSRRKKRISGLAIAAFSFLGAVILGGGIAFAVLNGAEDTPGGTGGVSVSQSPESQPDAQQVPEQGESTEGKSDAPSDQDGTADAGAGAGADTDAGADANAGNTGEGDSGTSGARPTTDKPAADKPSREPQSSPQQQSSDGLIDDPRSDGSPGSVAPQGPVAGY